MKNVIIIAIILVVIGVGSYFYFTRPVAAPTENISTQNEALPGGENVAAEKHYRISQEKSEVKFSINETLRNEPFTAVGVSNQVVGDFVIKNSAGAGVSGVGSVQSGEPLLTMGTIKADARTFKTDSSQRDGAINRFILKTETAGNEYVTFTPKKINNFPTQIKTGEQFSFSVDGDLTLSGITKPITIVMTMIQTDTNLSGTASMTVKRSDYKLTIPNIPFVANVSDTFLVTANFGADPVEE